MGQGVQAGLRRNAVEAAPGREPLRHGNKFRCGALAAACHDHGFFAPGVRQQLRQPLQAPGPVIHSGLRQGSTRASRPKQA